MISSTFSSSRIRRVVLAVVSFCSFLSVAAHAQNNPSEAGRAATGGVRPLSLPSSAAYQVSSCAPLKLTFKIAGPALRIDTNYSSNELRSMSSQASLNGDTYIASTQGDKLYQRHRQVMGLYSGNSQLKGRLQVLYTPVANAQMINVCISSIEMTLTRTPVIFIARETPTGCPLNEVYRHEVGHFNIETQSFSTIIPTLPAWAARTPNSFSVAHQEDSRQRIAQTLTELLRTASEAIFHAPDAAQTAHDSSAEYQRFSNSCPGQWPVLP